MHSAFLIHYKHLSTRYFYGYTILFDYLLKNACFKPGFVDMAVNKSKPLLPWELTCKEVTYLKISECILDSDTCHAED